MLGNSVKDALDGCLQGNEWQVPDHSCVHWKLVSRPCSQILPMSCAAPTSFPICRTLSPPAARARPWLLQDQAEQHSQALFAYLQTADAAHNKRQTLRYVRGYANEEPTMVSDDVPEGATTTQLHLGAGYTPSGATGSQTLYRPPGRLLLSLGGHGLRASCLSAQLFCCHVLLLLTAHQEQIISLWLMRNPVHTTGCALHHGGHPDSHA